MQLFFLFYSILFYIYKGRCKCGGGWDCSGLVSGVKCLTQGHNISGQSREDPQGFELGSSKL